MKLIHFNANKFMRQGFFEMKQKAEIILEIEETIVLRQAAKVVTAFCPQCAALVEMLMPEIAAALFNLSEREIFRLIENGRLHFTEGERIFICRNSLTNGTQPLPLTSGS